MGTGVAGEGLIILAHVITKAHSVFEIYVRAVV